jgi:hypothetical protein
MPTTLAASIMHRLSAQSELTTPEVSQLLRAVATYVQENPQLQLLSGGFLKTCPNGCIKRKSDTPDHIWRQLPKEYRATIKALEEAAEYNGEIRFCDEISNELSDQGFAIMAEDPTLASNTVVRGHGIGFLYP